MCDLERGYITVFSPTEYNHKTNIIKKNKNLGPIIWQNSTKRIIGLSNEQTRFHGSAIVFPKTKKSSILYTIKLFI